MPSVDCPYCMSALPEEATVCAHCTREVGVFRPLLKRIAEQAHRLDAQERRVDSLVEQIEHFAHATSHRTDGMPDRALLKAPPVMGRPVRSFVVLAVTVLLTTLLAHWLLLFAYDAKPLVHLGVTVMIPLPFAFFIAAGAAPTTRWTLITSATIGLSAVLAMSGITSLVDDVPWLPASTREWREVFEYSTSIGLSTLTGLFAASLLHQRESVSPLVRMIARGLATFTPQANDGTFAVERIGKRLQEIVTNVTPLITAASAVYAGLKSISGGG